MGCDTCTNKVGGTPKGCRSNGSCVTLGCNARTTYNWLNNIDQITNNKNKIVELTFKNGRKQFCRNDSELSIYTGDTVVVDCSLGYDVGRVTLTGELVQHQMQRKNKTKFNKDQLKIKRKATEEDLSIWNSSRANEDHFTSRSREMVLEQSLKMKISDVEAQGDGKKATFYYTAENRVDFRELIKLMSKEFNIKVEMKQIGSRQESSMLGGIGSCGRELCCSSWMTDFRSVTTSAARYQQLSLNPQKLSGQCGKLKCCLNYELNQYVEKLNDFPSNKKKLYSKSEKAFHIKTDVFRELMWYNVSSENKGGGIVCFKTDAVKEIQALNEAGKKPYSFSDLTTNIEAPIKEPEYSNVVGQDDLKRFDKSFSKNKKRKKTFKKKTIKK